MATLTNRDIKILTEGLRSALYIKGTEGKPEQRQLPLVPSIKIKRTLDDIENLYETISDAQSEKTEEVNNKQEELKEKHDDEGVDYSTDDFREDLNSFAENLQDEFDEFLSKEVDVTFSDPLKLDDVERLDESGEFPYSTSQAIEIILTKVVE